MKTSSPPPPHDQVNAPRPARYFGSRGLRLILGICVIGCAVLALWPKKSKASAVPDDDSVPVVPVAAITREEMARELQFDSELRPYQEVDVHSKVAGYVQNISVDIGDHVKEGQLLAELEAPELKDEIESAEAKERKSEQEIKRAEAAWKDAHSTLERLAAIDKAQPKLVAQQDLDTAQARNNESEAALWEAREQLAGARADAKKLRTMLKYCKITAPFDGVITKRYADKGALIQAGTSSSTQAMPLVRLSQNGVLRLVFQVSAPSAPYIKQNDPVEIEIPSLTKKVQGKIARFTQRLDFSTRSMETEVDLPNPDYTLIPGMYATAVVKVDRKTDALTAPVTAVERKGRPTVYVVKGNVIESREVTLGFESPGRIEITSGVREGDLVVVGSRAAFKPGERVSPRTVSKDQSDLL